jgi:2,5-diketo-D-gluconate reductase A
VATGVWNNDQGRGRTRRAFESSLSRLGLDHLDLYLIHWPAPGRGLYEQTWLTLTGLQREGLVRSIGVSRRCRCGSATMRWTRSPGWTETVTIRA